MGGVSIYYRKVDNKVIIVVWCGVGFYMVGVGVEDFVVCGVIELMGLVVEIV